MPKKNKKSKNKKKPPPASDYDSDDFDYSDDSDEAAGRMNIDDYNVRFMQMEGKWSSLIQNYYKQKADYLLGDITNLPSYPHPPPEERVLVHNEIKEFFTLGYGCRWKGTYCELLAKYHLPFDPYGDPLLQDVEINATMGYFMEGSYSEKDVEKIEDICRRGHRRVLQFARLSSWAAHFPDILPVEGKVIPLVNYTFAKPDVDVHYELTNEERPTVEAGMSLVMSGSPDKKVAGLYFLLNPEMHTMKKQTLLSFHLPIMYEYLDYMKDLYENAARNETVPLTSTPAGVLKLPWLSFKTADRLVQEACDLTFTALESCCSRGPIVFDFLSRYIQFLGAALVVDKRIILHMTPSFVDAIMQAQLRVLLNRSSPLGQMQEAEGCWLEFMNFTSRLSVTCLGADENGYRSFHSGDTAEARLSPIQKHFERLAHAMIPQFMRGLESRNNLLVFVTSLGGLDTLCCNSNSPHSVTTFLLKSSVWPTLMKLFELDAAEIQAQLIDTINIGEHVIIIPSLDETHVDLGLPLRVTTGASVCFMVQRDVLNIMQKMVNKAPYVHPSGQVKIGILGDKLLKRGIATQLYRMCRSPDLFIQRNAVTMLQILSRSEDIRFQMLEANKSDDVIRMLFQHPDPEIGSHTLLLAVRLLWDRAWLPIVTSPEYEIEKLMLKWGVVSIKRLHQISVQIFEDQQTSMYCMLKKKSAKPSEAQRTLSQYTSKDSQLEKKFLGFGSFYPSNQFLSEELLALTRVALVLLHLSSESVIGQEPRLMSLERLQSFRFFELMLACVPICNDTLKSLYGALSNFGSAGMLLLSDLSHPVEMVSAFIEFTLHVTCKIQDDMQNAVNLMSICSMIYHWAHPPSSTTTTGSRSAAASRVEWKTVWDAAVSKLYKGDQMLLASLIPQIAMVGRKAPVKVDMQKGNQNPILRRCSLNSCNKIELNYGDYKCCSACKTTYYCSPVCQKAHWPTHKPACKAAASR
jgi:hypothetical protein